MKTGVLLLLIAIGSLAMAQITPTYKTLKFDELVMFDFESSDKGGSIVEENGQLTKLITKRVQLDKQVAAMLNNKLDSRKSFGGGTAACFDPHLGFVYYLKGKIVGHITICMGCNRLRSGIEIAAQKQGKVGSGEDVYYIADGMSKSFRIFLNELLKTNNFSHQAVL